jgi:hypothetical protein
MFGINSTRMGRSGSHSHKARHSRHTRFESLETRDLLAAGGLLRPITGLQTSDNGRIARVSAPLTAAPSADVTISPASINETEGLINETDYAITSSDLSVDAPGVTLTNINSKKPVAPKITSADHVTFTVGKVGRFTVKATGSPKPTFGELKNSPSWLTFNTSTGVLSGNPVAGSAGTYNLTFKANNGVGIEATQNFTLTVNEAPAITSADRATLTVGTAGSFAVTATGGSTPDLSESGRLPAGITFDKTTGVLSGTPEVGTTGTYSLTFKASNGVGKAATQRFTLTVNEAPAITSPDKVSFAVGIPWSFSVTATGFPAPTFGDPGALPSGVTFNKATGVLSGTPAAGSAGTCNLTFKASNGVGVDATQDFTLTVTPTAQASAITSPDNVTFTAGTAGTFTVKVTGSPTPNLNLNLKLSNPQHLPAGITFNNVTGVLSGTPKTGTGGKYNLIFTASNGVGQPASQSFTLTVNETPAITSPDHATFIVGSFGSFTVTKRGYPTPKLSPVSAPAGLTFDPTTGVLSGTPAAGTAGTYPLTFTATNALGVTATQTFTLTIDEVPNITSPNHATFTVGTFGTFQLTATGSPTPNLAMLGGLPAGLSFNTSTGVLSGTPATGWGGDYYLTNSATSRAGGASQEFILTVKEAPAITSANQATFSLGQSASFTVMTRGYKTPNIKLENPWNLPPGVVFANGVLSGTPVVGTNGTYPLTFTASNDIGHGTQNFELTIEVDHPAASAAYSPIARGTLFGANGPSYRDVEQGALGDCWLLASLAEVAAREPADIQNMFTYNGTAIENGSMVGIYTVRLFDNAGAAHKIIVDTELPAGGTYYDHVVNGVLWVALAEKAYAQANGAAYVTTQHVGSDSYSAMDFGNASWALQAITGKSASGFSINPSDIAADWNAGQLIVLGTPDGPSSGYIVSDHYYALVGYDPSSSTPFSVFNPWGTDSSGWAPGYYHGHTVYGLFSADDVFLSKNFAEESVGDRAENVTDGPRAGGVQRPKDHCNAVPSSPRETGFAGELSSSQANWDAIWAEAGDLESAGNCLGRAWFSSGLPRTGYRVKTS